MITVFVTDYDTISQQKYDTVVSSLPIRKLLCSCGHASCLTKHAYYYRFIKTSAGKKRLRICRLKCSVCGKTHSLLLASMIPYSQISLLDQAAILTAAHSKRTINNIMESNPEIDENNIKYIFKQYANHWQQILFSKTLSIFPLEKLVPKCFLLFSRQFMQIKHTVNLLFPNPHNIT